MFKNIVAKEKKIKIVELKNLNTDLKFGCIIFPKQTK